MEHILQQIEYFEDPLDALDFAEDYGIYLRGLDTLSEMKYRIRTYFLMIMNIRPTPRYESSHSEKTTYGTCTYDNYDTKCMCVKQNQPKANFLNDTSSIIANDSGVVADGSILNTSTDAHDSILDTSTHTNDSILDTNTDANDSILHYSSSILSEEIPNECSLDQIYILDDAFEALVLAEEMNVLICGLNELTDIKDRLVAHIKKFTIGSPRPSVSTCI
jgi:hypothetical protein